MGEESDSRAVILKQVAGMEVPVLLYADGSRFELTPGSIANDPGRVMERLLAWTNQEEYSCLIPMNTEAREEVVDNPNWVKAKDSEGTKQPWSTVVTSIVERSLEKLDKEIIHGDGDDKRQRDAANIEGAQRDGAGSA